MQQLTVIDIDSTFEDRAIADEHKMIDVYKNTILLRNNIDLRAAFDSRFNAAIRRGQEGFS